MEKQMLAGVIIGIMLTALVTFVVHEEPKGVNELYFLDHEDIPLNVSLFTDYEFSYGVESAEPSSVDVSSEIELFNVYDITEGLHQCIRRSRPKATFEWEVENESNYEEYTYYESEIPVDENYAKMRTVIKGAVSPAIEWDEYALEFRVSARYAYGYMIADMDPLKLVMDFRNNRTILLPGETVIETPFDPQDYQHFLLRIKDGSVQIAFEQENLTNISLPSIPRSIRFKVINSFPNIMDLTAYVNAPVSVTRPDLVKDYRFQWESMVYQMNLLEQKRLQIINVRNTYGVDSKYETVNSWINRSPEINGSSLMPSYRMSHMENTSQTVNFTHYEISTSFTYYAGDGEVSIDAVTPEGRPAFGAIIHKEAQEALFYRTIEGNSVKVTIVNATYNPGRVTMNIIVNGTRADYYLNRELLVSVDDLAAPTDVNLTFGIGRSIIHLPSIRVQGLDPPCDTRDQVALCTYDYHTLSRPPRNSGSIQASSDDGASPNLRKALSRMLTIGELNRSAFEQLSEELNISNISQDYTLFMSQQFIYDIIRQNTSSYNPLIPDEHYTFDGPNARLQNLASHHFRFKYLALDGAKMVGFRFFPDDGEPIVFVLSELRNKAYLHDGTELKETDIEVAPERTHIITADYDQGTLLVKLDYTEPVFTIQGVNMSSGYFTVDTYNTYSELSELYMVDNVENSRIDLVIDEDPCELRLIGHKVLTNQTIDISSGETHTFKDTFYIEQDFDFGKVTVIVPSLNRSIHYWMTRR